MEASRILLDEYDVRSETWSVTSFNQLARDCRDVKRMNVLHPEKPRSDTYVHECLKGDAKAVIAATDYMASYAEQIREFVPQSYSVLGTDGFGRSDTRKNLRRFFEVDRYYIVVTTLKSLADCNVIDNKVVSGAIKKYGIDTEKPNPRSI